MKPRVWTGTGGDRGSDRLNDGSRDGRDQGPERRKPDAVERGDAQRRRGRQGQGGEGDRRPSLAHLVRLRERGDRGRQGRVRAARRRGGRHHRRRLRLGQADERHRDGARQEAERHPGAAARPDHLGAGVQAGRRERRQARASCRTCRPATPRARTMSASSPTISTRWASRRPTRSPRRSARRARSPGSSTTRNTTSPTSATTPSRTTIEKDYPDIKIVAEAGIADPARAEDIANALLTKNPDLDGIYVTWAEPAEGVLAALRSAGNTKTKIVTLDLSEPLALDMVQGRQRRRAHRRQGLRARPHHGDVAAYGLIGKEAPAFVVAPAITVTKANVADGWQTVAQSRAAAKRARRIEVGQAARRRRRRTPLAVTQMRSGNMCMKPSPRRLARRARGRHRSARPVVVGLRRLDQGPERRKRRRRPRASP